MFQYSALGDSITFGESASSLHLSYPWLMTSRMRKPGKRASCRIMAESGWTCSDLRNALTDDPSVIRGAHSVSLWIGGNDLAQAGLAYRSNPQATILVDTLRRFEKRYVHLLRMIRMSHSGILVCCTQFNPFPNTPAASMGIQQLNGTIVRLAKRYDAVVAPTHLWFAGKEKALIHGYRSGRIEDALSSRAPVHPNNAGHRLIASRMLPLLQSRK